MLVIHVKQHLSQSFRHQSHIHWSFLLTNIHCQILPLPAAVCSFDGSPPDPSPWPGSPAWRKIPRSGAVFCCQNHRKIWEKLRETMGNYEFIWILWKFYEWFSSGADYWITRSDASHVAPFAGPSSSLQSCHSLDRSAPRQDSIKSAKIQLQFMRRNHIPCTNYQYLSICLNILPLWSLWFRPAGCLHSSCRASLQQVQSSVVV